MVTINQKSIIDTHKKRDRKPNNTENNHQITREEKERRKKQKRITKNNPKAIKKWQYLPVHNYFKCKWTKFSNQKTYSD